MPEKFEEIKQTFETLVTQADQLVERLKKEDSQLMLDAIGEAAASLAHEIRNPLGSIKLAVGILREKIQCPELNKLLTVIDNSINSIDRTIEHILYFHRFKNPCRSLVEVSSVVQGVVDSMCIPENVSIFTNIPPFCYWFGDSKALERILTNLISNSVKAISRQAGCGMIKLSVIPNDEAIRIVVEDSGGGFDPDFNENTIVPFKSRFPGGIGLGLTIVKQLVEANNGQLRLFNTNKDGSVWGVVTIDFKKA